MLAHVSKAKHTMGGMRQCRLNRGSMTKPNQRIKARLLFRLGKSSFGKWVDEKHLSGVDGEMVWWFVTGAESVTGSVIALL